MQISIIGTAGCGKTTLFQALSGQAGSGAAQNTIATIDVPDERLEKLTEIFKPKKTVYTRIEISDTVSIEEGELQNETINPKTLRQMRTSDAFILVLRYFDNGFPVDPLAEFRTIYSEFMLSDMVQIENRLDRIRRQDTKKDNVALRQEKELLDQCFSHLEDGAPLCGLPVALNDEKALRGFQFLSQKPMMIVINCNEGDAAESSAVVERLRPSIPADIPLLAVSAKLEAELALMPAEEQTELLAEYGIAEAIRGRLIRLASDTLGLISFLTVGEDECRAWSIRRGMSAQEAAGTIHTDFYNKFIRAETVSYEAFMQHKGFEGCKKAGLWRLEGKTYVVQDGDIISVRAGN